MATDLSVLKDPARKRTFNPAPDVALMLYYWARANPHIIEARMFNDALRRYLKPYDRKRVPAILKAGSNGVNGHASKESEAA